jgi:ATPase family associated with various cellular activities (AAA)/Winged helix domain, variant
MSSSADRSLTLSFEALDARIRAAVESVATTDPNPADPFRGLYISDELAVELAREGPGQDVDARISLAARLLGLGELETAVLGLCAAPELGAHYGRLFAYLHDDVTRKLASPRLVARLLADGGVPVARILDCFDHAAPLRRTGALRLLDPGGQLPLADRLLKVSDRLAAHLLATGLDEPARDGRLRPVPVPDHDPGRDGTVEELRALLGRESPLPILVAGPDAEALLARALGRPLLLVDVAELGDGDLMREAAVTAALDGRVLCFDGLDDLEPDRQPRVQRALAALGERALLCAASAQAVVTLGDRTTIVVEAAMPSFAERRAAWAALTGAGGVDDVAAKFRLSIGQIGEAAQVAQLAATGRGEETPAGPDLDLGARRASSTRLAELASRLDNPFGWDDIVIAERQLEVLKSISSYLRHRDLVLSEWGYEQTVARTQGLKVLFAGESGTGKTMAGQVLARDLGLDLFRLDLATVVSKYIGETEKNLDRVFSAAEGSNAILFFDEADALFGKRSEVRDAHDRYANIEVAYLLQKMEGYPGAVILATNFRQNMDDAFLRRLDVVVDFPFPEPDDRERIWRLVLPAAAPLAGDIDVRFLAERFKLSGGGIRNCSLAAAFMAADGSGVIGMQHLVRAVALEYGKLGRLTLEADFEHFHELIRPQSGTFPQLP